MLGFDSVPTASGRALHNFNVNIISEEQARLVRAEMKTLYCDLSHFCSWPHSQKLKLGNSQSRESKSSPRLAHEAFLGLECSCLCDLSLSFF